jgi:hypothetical protein
MKKQKLQGWYFLGGFRTDPFLTKADKKWYEKRLSKSKLDFWQKREKAYWLKIGEREGKEFKKVEKMIRQKDEPKLGGWLRKFSGGWDFLAKQPREKFKKDDWL